MQDAKLKWSGIRSHEKIYQKMDNVLWFNTHHDVTHFQGFEIIEKQKFEFLENATWLFHKNIFNQRVRA